MTTPADAIRERIAFEGPISFAAFMEMALYGPGSYYERPPVGERGDFVTGPHVSPLFGRLLAGGIATAWRATGEPGAPAVVELGAGDGTLAEQLHQHLPDLRYAAVEISSGAREALTARGFDVVPSLADLARQATFVLANELLDNLPFHRIRREETLRELLIGLDADGGFEEVSAPCPPALAAAAPNLALGEEAAVSLASLRLVESVAEILETGYALFIDYARVPGEHAGGVHGYRGHRIVADILTDPGSTDITAPVDLDAVAVAAREAGLTPLPVVTQHDALYALGWHEAQAEALRQQAAALDDRDGRGTLRAMDARARARLLVAPEGGGSLRWLTLSTPGLPAPPWA